MPTPPKGWRDFLIAGLLAAGCLAVVVSDGIRIVRGSSLPYDLDQFRDIAAAQSIVDGHPLSDPFYRGETIWYNPLLATVVAGVSRVTGTDVATAFVQAGPFLNALAPIALFVMAAVCFGPWIGMLAVVASLFLPPHDNPPWATPTYSPWLFPANFSLAFFYVGFLLCWRAMRSGRTGWWVADGLWLGVTFLSHTAPAIILGACTLVALLTPGPDDARPPLAGRLRTSLLVMTCAVVVSSPLLWSIGVRYHFHVLNWAPNTWIWEPIGLPFAARILRGELAVSTLLVVAGAVVTAARLRRSSSARLIAVWGLLASLLFLCGWLQQMGLKWIPALLPQFHWFLYLRSLSTLLTAIGTWEIIKRIIALSCIWTTRLRDYTRPMSAAAAVVVSAVLIVDNAPGYRARPGGRRDRSRAFDLVWNESITGIRSRLRSETPPDAVVLASPVDSLVEVAPSGRRVVAVIPEFSNPYVDYDTRAWAQHRMLDTLRNGDFETFLRYAHLHDVSDFVLGGDDLQRLDAFNRLPDGAHELSRRGGVGLFELAGARMSHQ